MIKKKERGDIALVCPTAVSHYFTRFKRGVKQLNAPKSNPPASEPNRGLSK